MKGGLKIVRTIVLIAVPLILYVHQHVLLFQSSYHIHEKQRLLNHKMETFRRLKFEVDQRMAPRLLEDHVKAMKIELSLPKEINVVKMPAEEPQRISVPVRAMPQEAWSGRLVNWIGRWVDVAQAKEDNAD